MLIFGVLELDVFWCDDLKALAVDQSNNKIYNSQLSILFLRFPSENNTSTM